MASENAANSGNSGSAKILASGATSLAGMISGEIHPSATRQSRRIFSHGAGSVSSGIIDPGIMDYFFSHSGQQDSNAGEISMSLSPSMCASASAQESYAQQLETEFIFLVFSRY